jgi:hypothetical protein
MVCALTCLASPLFFAYLEAERLLGWPDAVYRWFDPWLPLVLVLVASAIAIVFPWFLGLFTEGDRKT